MAELGYIRGHRGYTNDIKLFLDQRPKEDLDRDKEMLKIILIVTILGAFVFGQDNLTFVIMYHGKNSGHS